MARDRDFSDLDVFAAPIQFRFNGQTKYKTSCGGLLTVCYLIVVAFVTAVMLKALITGRHINYASTTYDVLQTSDGLQGPVVITDMSLRFGFINTAPVLSSYKASWQALQSSIGRFELLNVIKASDGAI